MMVLHNVSGIATFIQSVLEPAQPSASRRQFYYFSVHLCMAYFLPQDVTLRTSDQGLSPFLTLLVLASVLPLLWPFVVSRVAILLG